MISIILYIRMIVIDFNYINMYYTNTHILLCHCIIYPSGSFLS